jgi:glutathione S-transferase
MADQYRLFGSELSPYSVKVRSYLRYKTIPHSWIVRGQAVQGEFQKHAKLPLIPLLVTPKGEAMQDSTPLIEEMERRYPEPALQPPDVPRAFLSALIEEYADEWCNKAMFHYRWTYEPDQMSASLRIASGILGADARPEHIEQAALGVRDRMVPRRAVVGSHDGTREMIEFSFRRQLEIAEAHLTWRPYLFGGRPCLADFGWAAQMYELASDPTPQSIMQHYPHTMAWVARMVSPVVLGEFEPWEKLSGTLTPLLQDEVARRYLPWADANMKAVQAETDWFDVDLGGSAFSQAPQKYHVKSVAVIREKAKAALEQAPQLATVLKDTGCFDLLTC